MKRTCFALAAIAGVFIGPGVSHAASNGFVQIGEAAVRSGPQAYGRLLGVVPYKQKVQILEEQGAWFKVKAKSSSGQEITGYMHGTALLGREQGIAKGRDSVVVEPDQAQVVLASKGLIEAAEKEFRLQNTSLESNFKKLDSEGKVAVSESELLSFAKEGGL